MSVCNESVKNEAHMDLDKKQIPELRKFIAANYSKDYVLLNEEFFDWCFKNYVCQQYSFKVLEMKDRLVGMIGILPYDFKFFQKKVRGHFLLNLMIDAPLRNLGLGPRLVLESGQGADFVYTTSYGASAKPMYQKLQWTEMGELSRFVYVLDIEKCSNLAETGISQDNKPEELLDSDLKFFKIDSFGESYNDFWLYTRKKYPITIERTSAYLNWRYRDHPSFSYHMFQTMKKDQVHAYAILRFEEPQGYKIGRIIDFASNDDAEEFTLNSIRDYCREEGACLIDFMFTGKFHRESLRRCGWKDAKTAPYDKIPMLFNPIDRNRKGIPFAFKILNDSLQRSEVNNIDNWYITKGDGDQDRPN